MGCGFGDPPNAKNSGLESKKRNKYAIGILLKLKYFEDDSAHPVNGQVDCGNVHFPQVLLGQIVIIILLLVVTLFLLLIELYF
jgi:hypothetical protein